MSFTEALFALMPMQALAAALVVPPKGPTMLA